MTLSETSQEQNIITKQVYYLAAFQIQLTLSVEALTALLKCK